MACTAASHPDMCPAHTWRGPAESWMSSVMVAAIAFPMILRTVSPIPMGRTPGHLSRAISLHAKNADNPCGSTKQVQSRLATDASMLHNSAEAVLNEVQSCFHAAVSRPDGPAAPSILRAVLRMSWPSILSKMIGCGSVSWMFGVTIVDSLAGCFGGCFLSRASRTVFGGLFVLPFSTRLSNRSGWPLLPSEISLRADLTLPSIMSLENVLDI